MGATAVVDACASYRVLLVDLLAAGALPKRTTAALRQRYVLGR
jgi:hypothetical protein